MVVGKYIKVFHTQFVEVFVDIPRGGIEKHLSWESEDRYTHGLTQ